MNSSGLPCCWQTSSLSYFFYRLFGKTGLFIWIPIAGIIANIQVLKVVDLFGINATLGNIVYASSFLVTDILSENYGKKSAAKAVFVGFLSLIASMILFQAALWFTPAADDWAQDSLVNIFGFMPRIVSGKPGCLRPVSAPRCMVLPVLEEEVARRQVYLAEKQCKYNDQSVDRLGSLYIDSLFRPVPRTRSY